jgi:molecular chaperone HscB
MVCANCHERLQGPLVCSSCGKLQSAQDTDYFALFGLPRKLCVDMGGLEQKFLKLSWKLHPDKFVNSSEEEKELSLRRSSELNDAYRAVKDPVARVEYLLAIAGERKEGEKKQQAPPELLEEVFELNESLDELREARSAGADVVALRARLQVAEKEFGEKLAEVDKQMQASAKDWDAAIDAGAGEAAEKKIMMRLNEHLNRRAYIRNLVVSVAKELAEA